MMNGSTSRDMSPPAEVLTSLECAEQPLQLEDIFDEAPLQQRLDTQPIAPIATGKIHTSSFAAWSKRVLDKKRRADSVSSRSSTNTPKRQPLLGLREGEEVKPLGSVDNPILLPLLYNAPFVISLSTTSLEPAKQRQVRRTREFEYHGVHSLLACNGCSDFFPAQAQTLIEKQQKCHWRNGVSQYVFDKSFEESMIYDGRGKIGERGFSSTGASVREVAAVTAEGETVAAVPEVAKDSEAELTSSERVLDSYKLLEAILMQYMDPGHVTLLNAQRVNKAFAQVIRRSTKLKRLLRGN